MIFRLSRDMNNKRISCVAKNNEINDPKTRTVTVQMNRKKNTSYKRTFENGLIFSTSSECEDTEERNISD